MNDVVSIALEQFDVFPSYKGGHTCLYGKYIWEFCPGHHLQNKWGWVAQHRMVAEDKLGRPLRRSRDAKVGEHVHHLDGNPANNHPDNLEILTKSEHHRHESRKYAASINQHLTDENARKALEGRTIREAAAALGVTHMTLRRRCPDAVAPRKRTPPCDINNPSNMQRLRELAADSSVCIHQAALELKMAERTIQKVCQLYDIEWVRKSKKGMLHRTYRGKPTRRALELRASGIDPESTRSRQMRRKDRLERRGLSEQGTF